MVKIGDKTITFQTVWDVAFGKHKVSLSASARKNVSKTRAALELSIDGKKMMYGITTGFGAFKNTVISRKDVKLLQENLILSHAVGVGERFDETIVRSILFIIANYLAKGRSGVRPVVITTLLTMLNKGIYPIIPQKGSVGSSGDLAPSAHVMLVLMGKGEATYKGVRMSGATAMRRVNLTPITLEAKEGLALINNTATMTAIAAIALAEAQRLANIADIAGALSAQALLATPKAYDSRVHALKPHPGQVLVAARMRKLLAKSKMLDRTKIQDQYSLRAIPQVHGAVREAISYAKRVVNTELNSVTDNPLVFVLQKNKVAVLSAGNFHGEAVAIAMDSLGLAISEFANISDRRIASLLDPAVSNGLPAFLTLHGGLNSGMMILQYTTAALVSENKVLAHPASVDSIPTSANVEDLVSMGTISARKARQILENVRYTLAIELLVACQAVDFRRDEGYRLSPQTDKIYKKIRMCVPFFKHDTVYYPYIEKLAKLIKTGTL